MSKSSLWPLGVAIYVSGTIGEALGANLQRKSLTTEAEHAVVDPSYQPRKKLQQKQWLFGFILFVSAGICMSVALFFASQTVLAPLQLFLFVSNSIFANWINKENFNFLGLDGIFLLLVVIGVTMSIISAPKHTESYSNSELLSLMRQPGFIAFCCFAGAFISAVAFTKHRILASCRNDPRRIRSRWLRTSLNMSYGFMAGAFGGVNVTLTKTVFSLIVGQFNDGGVLAILSSPVLWVVSMVLVGTWVLQIVVTVSGLEVTSAIIVISAHSVAEEVMATSGGILYFQDYLKFSTTDWAVFITGNVIAICSVVGLSHLRLRDAEDKEHEQQEVERAIEWSNGAITLPPPHSHYRKRAASDGLLLRTSKRSNKRTPDDCVPNSAPNSCALPCSSKELLIVDEEDPEVGITPAPSQRTRKQTW